MSRLPHADSFEDLIVYQKARALALQVFSGSAMFPKEELYALTGQIRRSSRAVGAQIAEAWAKRPYTKHFIAKLTDADGEQQETQHWIRIAGDCGYWPAETCAELRDRCLEIGRLLAGMISKADLFCAEASRSLRESPVEYFAATDD